MGSATMSDKSALPAFTVTKHTADAYLAQAGKGGVTYGTAVAPNYAAYGRYPYGYAGQYGYGYGYGRGLYGYAGYYGYGMHGDDTSGMMPTYQYAPGLAPPKPPAAKVGAAIAPYGAYGGMYGRYGLGYGYGFGGYGDSYGRYGGYGMYGRYGKPPTATVGVDVDGDGKADFLVTGSDLNRDGIPDLLQGNAYDGTGTMPT